MDHHPKLNRVTDILSKHICSWIDYVDFKSPEVLESYCRLLKDTTATGVLLDERENHGYTPPDVSVTVTESPIISSFHGRTEIIFDTSLTLIDAGAYVTENIFILGRDVRYHA